MPFGTNDAAVTTNDLVTQFEPEVVRRLAEEDPFAPFFSSKKKPAGIGNTANFVIETTFDEAIQQPPLAHRVSRERGGFEVNIEIRDKYRDSRAISWEKIRKGRLDEVGIAVRNVTESLLVARIRRLGAFLLTNAAQNSGTPTDPAAPAAGQSPYWWNTNDTVAPPGYGENTFSAGHDHVETGVTALTIDRLRLYMASILEHGYGKRGFVTMFQNQEERTLLNLAQTVQQNQTLGVGLREEFQRAGRASAVNGLLGMQLIVNEYVPAGVMGVWDAGLAGLPGGGGAVRVVELEPTTDREDDKDIQATWFEAYEQYGAGILHKAAGYTAHVA